MTTLTLIPTSQCVGAALEASQLLKDRDAHRIGCNSPWNFPDDLGLEDRFAPPDEHPDDWLSV